MPDPRRRRVVETAALVLVLAPLAVLLLFGRNAGLSAGVAVITGALGVPLFIGVVLWWLDRGAFSSSLAPPSSRWRSPSPRRGSSTANWRC